MSENSGFNAVFGGLAPQSPTINRKYGSFHSETTQILVIPSIATPVNLEFTDESDGVSISITGGTISFDTAGKYMVEATILFKNNAPLAINTGYVWLKRGMVDIPQLTRLITLNANITTNVLTLSYMVDISDISIDTLNFYWTATSTDLEISYTLVSGLPNVASVIVNVFQIANER